MSLTVVIGGTRSGKSARAEEIARLSGRHVRYIATADGRDPSMSARIRAHVEARPSGWTTVEAEESLSGPLSRLDGACALIDGLGTWIAGSLHRAALFDGDPTDAAAASARENVLAEMDALIVEASGPEHVIVVVEQAGGGVHPADRASRLWVDILGEATQRLAGAAERVELVVAGLPLPLVAPPEDLDADLGALRRHGDRDARAADADHAVNVIAGGPPSWLRDALRATIDDGISRYPDDGPACQAIAILHGRDAAEVVPTNGAAEALWLLPLALRPRHAVCLHPGFTEAEYALRAHRIRVTRMLRDPARDFALDPTAVPEDADLVIVGNPASPSGTLAPRAVLHALRRAGRTVVVDEAFMDLVPGEPVSLIRERLDDVIVVRSMTKSLSVPGLRAGYAVAAEAIADRLRAARPPWSANALALAALVATASRVDPFREIAERAQGEREDLEERLSTLRGVRTWPSAANFCLIEVDDGPGVVSRLAARSIAVRPAASFPGLGAGHIRLTARSREENGRLVAALQEAIDWRADG